MIEPTIIEVTGRYQDAAKRKPAWQDRKAIERREYRSWQIRQNPNEIGAWGEAALCQFLGIDPEPEMFKQDPSLPDVCGVDVKTTTVKNGHLIISDPKVETEHVLAVVSIDRRFVHLVGWLPPERINDDGRFPMIRRRENAPPARWIHGDALDSDLGALCSLVYQRRFGILI